MFPQIAPLFLAATLAMLLIAVLPPGVSGGTHIDVGLGQNRFFLGEQFLITFKDVIYWVAGMCMGLLFAMTFLLVGDLGGMMGVMKEKSSGKRGGAQPKEDTGATRDKRLIGSKKYPTYTEERVLSAIHTEPENYVAGSEQNRQGRLVGFPELFPSVNEERMLEMIDSQPDNSFDQDDMDDKDELDSEPSVASRLFKILFSLPVSHTEDDSTESKLDINHFF